MVTSRSAVHVRTARLFVGALLALAYMGLTPLSASAATCQLNMGTLTINLAGSEDVRFTSDATTVTATYTGGTCTELLADVTQIVVVGGSGGNTVIASTSLNENIRLQLGGGRDSLVILGTAAAETFTFSAAAGGTVTVGGGPVYTGTDSVEVIRVSAAGGDDVIDASGSSGGSYLVLRGGSGNDRITGSYRADYLGGGGGSDTIYGLGGNDVIRGGGGADLLYGGAGNDRIYGGAGRDRIFGGSGADSLYGDGGHDRLVGGYGNDLLVGGAGRDRCLGGPGRDVLRTC